MSIVNAFLQIKIEYARTKALYCPISSFRGVGVDLIGLWFFGDRGLLGLGLCNILIDACVFCDAYKEDSVHII